jgi:hypothetical protein
MNLATEAPTFYSLNKSQKRALLLRDQLRYTDAHHLDNFIEGVGDPEPPAFKRSNGVIYPPLVMVTLKDSAAQFNLGNVRFEAGLMASIAHTLVSRTGRSNCARNRLYLQMKRISTRFLSMSSLPGPWYPCSRPSSRLSGQERVRSMSCDNSPLRWLASRWKGSKKERYVDL